MDTWVRSAARTAITLLLGLVLMWAPRFAAADIPWTTAVQVLAKENAALASRPQGHDGTYFVICTIYYTPMETGFKAERGFDVTPETRPGLGGRKHGREFLLSVKKEGIGKIAKPVNGKHYIRYEGRGAYSYCDAPTGLKRKKITPRQTAAARKSQRGLYGNRAFEILDPGITSVFGNSVWRIGDAGGALRKWQLDLYWGEDEPMGPGALAARPKGTLFEYGLTRIRLLKQ